MTQWRCELTPYSQRAHLMTHTVRLLWAFYEFAWMCLSFATEENKTLQKTSNSHRELVVRYLWDHVMTHHAVAAVGSLWELQTHGKLTITASSQCEFILWVNCELTGCPQNEPSVRFMWAPSELAVSSNSSRVSNYASIHPSFQVLAALCNSYQLLTNTPNTL